MAIKHVAVNTRLLLKGKIEGIGRYAYEILKRMVENHPEVQFTFIFDRPWDEEFIFGPNVTPIVIFPPSRHAFLWYFGFHFTIPRLLSTLKPDLFYSPEPYLTNHKKIPQVNVFHDLDYVHRPQDIGSVWSREYLLRMFPYYARKSTLTVSVSEYTKQSLIDLYHLSSEKIYVVNSNRNPVFQAISESEKEKVRAEFAGGNRYFYFAGTMQPRKNVENLLLAFDLFKQKTPSDIKLILVGRQGWKTETALKIYESMIFKDDVVFTGFVSDEDMNRISGGAIACCFVSFLEGFGLPPLEAMHAETPSICSDRGAIPEVCGDAVHYINPDEPESIAAAMLLFSTDEAYRQTLIEKGKERRTLFTWEKNAENAWKVLELAYEKGKK